MDISGPCFKGLTEKIIVATTLPLLQASACTMYGPQQNLKNKNSNCKMKTHS